MVAVAKLYYDHGLTHQQIAAELGLSRVKVTRLLAQARLEGIVEIRINEDEEPFAELAHAVAEKFGLDRVWVAPTAAANSTAVTGASALAHHLTGARVVGVGLSLTLGSAVTHLPETDRPARADQKSFAPMAGGWGGWQQGLNPGELAVRLAHRLGGRAFGFPAPLLAPSQGFAEALQQLPEVRQALELAGSADCLAFGVGGLDWGTSPLNDSISAAERESLVRQGAVGDVAARFFDRSGNPVETTVDKRAIGLRLDQMVSVPTRLLLAHGPSKVEAIHASLVGGMATVLVTDSDTARSLEQMT